MSDEASASTSAAAASAESTSSPSESKSNLTEEHFNLIAQSYDEFNDKKYTQSSETLQKLEEITDNDCKIAHNRAVVEFYKSDLKDILKFLEFLDQEIRNQNIEPKTNRNMPIIYLNKAITMYYLKKPYHALKYLDLILNKKFDDIDKLILSRAGLLYLTLLLETNQLRKAYGFLKAFEKYFEQYSNTTLLSSSSSLCDDSNKGSDSDLSLNSLNIADNFKGIYKFISSLIKIIHRKNILIPDETNFEFTILKAYQYYIVNDYEMAAKELSKNFTKDPFSFETHFEDPDVIVANNMGVIHLRVRNYAIGATFLQHAITFNNKISEKLENNETLLLLGASKRPEILYNLGLALLHLQRPDDAFECFLGTLQFYNQNPRLWFRIAEACIMMEEKKKKESESKSIISAVIGSGTHRKFVLEPTPKIKSSNEPLTKPEPTFEYASACLENAVSLAEHYKEELIKMNNEINAGIQEENWQKHYDEYFCNPSSPITIESLDKLLAAIYAAYSYVSIRLGNYHFGLLYGKKLLSMENLSDANIMLGHLYCAEALINLDKLDEAQAYLEPKFITNLNPHHFESKEWQVNSLDAAQAILRYNLVVTLVMQGEFGVAKALLVSCNHPILEKKYKMLKMYIDIATSNDNNPIDIANKMKVYQN